MTGEHKPFSVVSTPFNAWDGRFCPDGRLIAYASDESGRDEVYVQAFPQAVERWQISAIGFRIKPWAIFSNVMAFLPRTNGGRRLAGKISFARTWRFWQARISLRWKF